MFWRWGSRLPFQSRRAPRIRISNWAMLERPNKVDEWQEITNPKNGSSCRREDVIDLKLLGITEIPAWHSKIAKEKLWEKRQVETDVGHDGRQLAELFGIEPACNFRPPVVQPAHKGRYHSSHHDIVKMRDNKVRVRHVDIDTERCEKQSRHAANGKQPNESQCIQHGGL